MQARQPANLQELMRVLVVLLQNKRNSEVYVNLHRECQSQTERMCIVIWTFSIQYGIGAFFPMSGM